MAGSCEYSNENSDSIKGVELPDQLGDYHFPKKDFIPCSR
jgi:hypothetical protein